jgi:hypothetical protein
LDPQAAGLKTGRHRPTVSSTFVAPCGSTMTTIERQAIGR